MKRKLLILSLARNTAPLAAVWVTSVALAAESPEAALQDFKKGDFARARAMYEKLAREHPDDPRFRFNAGAASYKQNDWTNALGWFESALGTPNVDLQQKAYFNLGDTHYRMGEGASNRVAKLAYWRDSLTNFSGALRLNPGDTNASANLSLVRKKLEELEQQQPPPPQNSGNDPDSQDKDKKTEQRQDQRDKQEQQQDQSSQQNQRQDQQSQRDQQNAQSQEQKDAAGQRDQPKGGENEQKAQQSRAQPRKADPAGKQDSSAGTAKRADGPNDGEQPQGDGAAEELSDVQGKAGAMSPAQAARLLDSQKSEEKALLLSGTNRPAAGLPASRNHKPW